MAVKTYKYNDKTQLTKHFKVSEWKCKCGKNHEIKIDDKLPIVLENLLEKLGAAHGNIYSGYRCPEYDKKVGGRGTGSHTLGYSVDIRYVDSNGKTIPSSKVCLTLEDMNHQYGIGYRAGGARDVLGNTHIDTRPRKWYGDETISNTLAIWDIKKGVYSFYDYLGIKKEPAKLITPVSRDETSDQIEVLINDLNARDNANGKVLGLMPKGIYNVLEEKEANGYLWVRVSDNIWFATKENDWTKRYKVNVEDDSSNDNDDIEVTIPDNGEEDIIDDNDTTILPDISDEIIIPGDSDSNEDMIEIPVEDTNNNDNISIWKRIANFFVGIFNKIFNRD